MLYSGSTRGGNVAPLPCKRSHQFLCSTVNSEVAFGSLQKSCNMLHSRRGYLNTCFTFCTSHITKILQNKSEYSPVQHSSHMKALYNLITMLTQFEFFPFGTSRSRLKFQTILIFLRKLFRRTFIAFCVQLAMNAVFIMRSKRVTQVQYFRKYHNFSKTMSL